MSKIYRLKPDLVNVVSDYRRAIERRYEDFIAYAEIPAYAKNTIVDTSTLPIRLEKLYKNINELIDDKYNILINVLAYNWSSYMVASLLDTYFINCLNADKYVNTVVYIDTQLLLDDFRKLMDKSMGDISSDVHLSYTTETIYQRIEKATMVIWDKFSLINSAYEKQRIVKILASRKRSGLGNIFIVADRKLMEKNGFLDANMLLEMNIDTSLDCKQDSVSLLNT